MVRRELPLETPLTPVVSLVSPHPEGVAGTPATPPVEGEPVAGDAAIVEPPSVDIEPLPSRIGRFKVLKRLGSGGMGVVYVAYDDALGRKVALKVLRTSAISVTKRVKARDRLKREAQAMAKLSHPHVITIYDVGQIDDQIFLAMEFVKGVTLTKWCRSAEGPQGPRRRTWQEVLVVFIQAGRGLSAAHRNGIIHRDFKPDNVLIDAEGRVRVGDFGLARSDGAPLPRPDTYTEVIKSVSSEKSMLDMRITRTGGMTGTPAYMAPEQYLGQPVDARTDQFSFCVALYEGLYGQRPFVGDRVSLVREAVISGRIQDVPKDIEVPQWLRKVILRGLSVRPHDRYRSMDELLDHLTEAPRPALRGRRLMLAAAAAVVLAAVAVGVYDVMSTRAAPLAAAPPCEPPDLGWDARRDPVARALAVRPGGDTAGPAALAAFDARAAELQDMYAETCRMGDDMAVAPDALARRRACLERRRSGFHGLVRAVGEASGPALDRAITALDALPAPRDCDDPRQLPAVAPPASDQAAAAELLRLREGLDHAAAVLALGDAPRAWEVAQALLPAAEQSDDLPTRAQAQYVRAALERALGRVEAAERALEGALWAAEASRQDEVVVDALSLLLAVESEDLARRGEARRLWPRLSAALRRLGDDGRRAAAASARHGQALLREGDVASAYEQLSAALTRGEQALGADHLRLIPVLLDLALACQRTGRTADAARHVARAGELAGRLLPPEHPTRARVLTVAADLARASDEPAAARRQYDEALAVYAKIYGQDHPDMSSTLLGRGLANAGEKRWSQAAGDLRRALAAWEHVFGPEYPRLVEPLTGLCAVESALGEHAAAQAACGRAVALATRAGSLDLASVARFAQARALAAEAAARGDDSPEARAQALAVARQAFEEAQAGGDAALTSAIAAWIAGRR